MDIFCNLHLIQFDLVLNTLLVRIADFYEKIFPHDFQTVLDDNFSTNTNFQGKKIEKNRKRKEKKKKFTQPLKIYTVFVPIPAHAPITAHQRHFQFKNVWYY